MSKEVEELKDEIQRLREQIHKERNEAAVEYGNYELTIRELKKELNNEL